MRKLQTTTIVESLPAYGYQPSCLRLATILGQAFFEDFLLAKAYIMYTYMNNVQVLCFLSAETFQR